MYTFEKFKQKNGGINLAIGDIIVGVDIGTSKVSTVVGEVNNFSQVEIICNTSYKCSGLKKGKIINEDEIILSLAKTIKDAEEETNLKINSAYVTIPGKYVTIVQNSITKEVKDKYAGISVRDVQNAIMQVKDIEVPEGQNLIDIVPDKITLENGTIVTDPVGKLSSNFTISAQVILADRDYVRQLSTIFKKAGLEIDGIVPITLAERNLVLDTNELHDNIMLLDIGAGNTDIGVFEGSTFLYTNSIPLGGDTITNDIALVLNISEEEADKLKRQYGLALKSFIDNDNDIILNTRRDNNKNKIIKSSELIEIIEARIEEMFSIINKDITNQGLKQKINNVILTGQGIVNINKSDVAGKINLNIPVKISTGRAISTVKPAYRTSYALVRYIAARPFAKTVSSNIDTQNNESILKTIFERIKEFFYS
ncbi:MAG: cell division protein FtsA [Clostridiales bacterium]|nr:cell division protein FtsA [Clostridiales bacterium]